MVVVVILVFCLALLSLVWSSIVVVVVSLSDLKRLVFCPFVELEYRYSRSKEVVVIKYHVVSLFAVRTDTPGSKRFSSVDVILFLHLLLGRIP